MKYISQVVKYICPAYAGVILSNEECMFILHDLSRVCGGDPRGNFDAEVNEELVPRMRG